MRKKLDCPLLCLVTNTFFMSSEKLEDKIVSAITGGVGMIQLRDKTASGSSLLKQALRLKAITDGKSLLVINGSVEVALACNADGVHLPEDFMDAEVAREISGDLLLIGKSVHDLKGAELAQKNGSDYVILGTIFTTESKPSVVPSGTSLMNTVTNKINIPVLGIGGINPSNAGLVVGEGASGVAVISYIVDADDHEMAAKELKEAIVRASINPH